MTSPSRSPHTPPPARSTHSSRSPDPHPHSTSTSRNPTRCRSMSKRRIDGKKLPLDIDLLRGKIKYEHKLKLSTYLGKLVKDHVSIQYKSWKEVPEKPDKEMLWKVANFDVSQITDLGLFQKKCLQSIGIKWRNFKSDLTSEYIYGPSKGKSPCEKYGISEEDWRDFKKIRDDSDWEERRGKNKS
ncbi:hypothetical protein OROHE_000114 [Orobanche hederae]